MPARRAGAPGKENVGMSNDKGCEKHPRRKTKGSGDDANQNRVSRVLRCSREAKPMANRLIFLYPQLVCEGGTEVRKARPATEVRVEGR